MVNPTVRRYRPSLVKGFRLQRARNQMHLNQEDAASVASVLSDLDWLRYAPMLPISLGVAFLANTAGIGGAALFSPIFLLVFPALDEWRIAKGLTEASMDTRFYALESPAASIGTALAVEFVGFTSGLIGYMKRGLVDFVSAAPLIAITTPCALVGATIVNLVPLLWLKGLYSAFMLMTGIRLIVFVENGRSRIEESWTKLPATRTRRIVEDSKGQKYEYSVPPLTAGEVVTIGVGGWLCGLGLEELFLSLTGLQWPAHL